MLPARVWLLPMAPQVGALCVSLGQSIASSELGLAESATLLAGTRARSAACAVRVRREQRWLGDAEERLAQQRASLGERRPVGDCTVCATHQVLRVGQLCGARLCGRH